jgi:hypothetical protein
MTTNPERKQQELLSRLLILAKAGDEKADWLINALTEAGYRQAGLYTQHEIMRGLGVTQRTITNWCRDGLPRARESKGRIPALFDVFAVCQWRIEHVEAKVRAKIEDDPLLGGETSPALEKYRREKWRQAKRENDVAEGLLIPVAYVLEHGGAIAGAFRQRADMAQRTYGREVGQFLAESINEAAAALERLARPKDAEPPKKRGRGRPRKKPLGPSPAS